MYYSKTAALDRHVCELHRIITKVEPKAPQKNASTENKCKMSNRELNNRIERLVLLAYTLRRKSSNEPFVPATEQEWAHLYMNGMCVKKYYTCQGRQVYVPKKIEDSTGRGCSDRSDKYNDYLTDCGGKGGGGKSYGGSGGITGLGTDTSGLSEVARLLRNLTEDIIITNNKNPELEKLYHEAFENDEKTFEKIDNNTKFINDGNVLITYDNLLFIIIIISILNKENNSQLDKIYDIKTDKDGNPIILSKSSEIEKQKMEENIQKYDELKQKATKYFEQLKNVDIKSNVNNENNKNEHEMVDNVLKISILKEKEDENDFSTKKESQETLDKISYKGTTNLKNMYANITTEFFKNRKYIDPNLPLLL